MEGYDALVGTLALTMGASWASGINLYAAMLVLGVSGMSGGLDLPPDLEILANPLVVGAAGLMYGVEFFADKVPGVDSLWDGLSTFVRIPAGAMLAAGAVGDVSPVMEMATAVMGGSLAATSHFTKAGTRALINTSPEPFTNWGASITEDAAVFGGLWVALNNPVLFLVLLVVFVALVIWLLPKIWRLIIAIFKKIGSWIGLVDKSKLDPSPALAMAGGGSGAAATESASAAEDSAKDNIAAQIADLQKLHKDGALSDEEFQQVKVRLLHC